jgi:phosphatidylglycerol lysyltransferase
MRSSSRKQRRDWSEGWDVRIVALLTALMGIINVLSAVTPSVRERVALLNQFLPVGARHGARMTAALTGFALLLVAGNLWRRKRVAWLLTLILLGISVVSHLLEGLDYEEAGLAAALAVWVWYMRPHFHARSDPPSVQQGVRALLLASLFTLGYGVAGFWLLDRHFTVNFGFSAAVEQTIIMFVQFYDPGLQPVTSFGRYFADSIYVVGAVTLVYALWMLFRPVLVRQPATSAERARAKAIVENFGRSSLARFALFDDKSYYFSPGGSVVAYAAKGRVGLALGDPTGPEDDVADAVAGFQAFCLQNDWQPAFYQTLPDYLEVYQTAGFDALCIGQEAIVDLETFTLAGRANKSLRSNVNKLTRLGHRTEFHEPPLSDALLHELRVVSDEWLTMVEGKEMRFSLGQFDDDYVRHSRVMAVYTPDGWISAFANVVPEYQRNEVTVDLMRRREDIESGTMDFLFVRLFEWARQQSYATFNLGLSALAGVGDAPGDPTIERALHYVYENVKQTYSFQGLHAFKEKFHPRWSPRYLIYAGSASLPAVTLAMTRAISGDRFVWDYLSDFLRDGSRPS